MTHEIGLAQHTLGALALAAGMILSFAALKKAGRDFVLGLHIILGVEVAAAGSALAGLGLLLLLRLSTCLDVAVGGCSDLGLALEGCPAFCTYICYDPQTFSQYLAGGGLKSSPVGSCTMNRIPYSQSNNQCGDTLHINGS